MQSSDGVMMNSDNADKNNRLLRAVNQVASLLLTANDDGNISNQIQTCLEILGHSLEADRVYIWKNIKIDDEIHYKIIHTWIDDPVRTMAYPPNVLNSKHPGLFNLSEKFLRGEYINSPISELPENNYEFFKVLNIGAIVIIPIFFNNHFWGIFSVDVCDRIKYFSTDEISILQSVSLMITNSISRNLFVEERTHDLAIQTAILTTLLDSIPGHVFTKNLNSQFMHVNKKVLKHFNKKQDDVIGKSSEGLGLSGEIVKKHAEEDQFIIRENCTVTVEENIPRYDGKNPLFETTKMPLIIDGTTVGIMGIAYDITKLKENELQTSLKYKRAMVLKDSLAAITNSKAVSSGDLKQTAELIVQECCTVLNISNAGVWRLSSSNDKLINYASYNVESGENFIDVDFDLKSRPKYKKMMETERLIVIEDASHPMYDLLTDGYGSELCAALDAPIRISGVMTGIICAEQNKTDEYPDKREWSLEEQSYVTSLSDLMALAIISSELREAQETADAANKAKSSFLANMSHEIRTPMNTILGVVDIIMNNDDHNSETEEGLDRIYNSCNLLLSITNDILDFSKIEAGKLSLEPVQYKVANLISETVKLYIMQMQGKSIEFEIQVDENVPANLIGDELRIKQIMGNLLSNAFKYTEKGKVILTVVCQPWESEDGVTLVIVVRDTGYGIPKDQLDDLFTEYSRVANKANATIEGTGLGLAITRSLIDLMDGGINVESEPGFGSVFVVKLPQRTVDDEVLGKEVVNRLQEFRLNYMTRNRRTQITRDHMPYGKILIVDDVETNLYVATGLMKPYGLYIETVMSGIEAIEQIENGKVYDVIFMDHMMPEPDGIETTKRLRALGYGGTIVALTANAVVGQAEIFLQNGFDEFISKPIDIRQLNSVLNKHVRDKQSPEVLEMVRREKDDQDLFVVDGHVMDTNNTAMTEYLKIGSANLSSVERSFDLMHKKISGIDLISGLQRYESDIDVYSSIIRSYTGSVRSILKSIENVREEDLSDYKIKVHGIKGASYDIFAEKVGDSAKELETAAQNKDFRYVIENNPEFIEMTNKLIDDLEELFSDIKSDESKSVKDIPDPQLLSQLLTACRTFNINKAEEVVDELEKYEYESGNELIAWLRENVDVMNFSGITERLKAEEVD